MKAETIILFLHIVGAIGFFIALGLEWTGLSQLQGAQVPEQVRIWMGILKSTQGLGFSSMLTAVITGIYMMLTEWGFVPWIYVTIGSLLLVILLSMLLTRPQMVAIGKAMFVEKGRIIKDLPAFVNHPYLRISINTRVAIALGIVYLKTAKPELGGSLLAIGVAIALGLATSLYLPRHKHVQEEPIN
jgi:hypothetical protein